MYQLIRHTTDNGFRYGIREKANKKMVVEICHDHPLDAIEEWMYYQNYNTNKKKFLNIVLTNEQIEEQHNNLLKQMANFFEDH